ncbi:MAG: TlpA family protein disulfide reductase [Frankia sp.]|nr:TlpA family protein disulfide reductase [Frankia sp.]
MAGVTHILGGVLDRRRRRLAGLAFALVVGLAGVTACSGTSADASGGTFGFVQQAPGEDFAPPNDRSPAPALAGETLVDGETLDVASLRGKVVVVNFWASWCAPCRAEAKSLVELANERPDVAFVGVNSKDGESPAAARAFARDFNVPYPSIRDPLGKLSAGWPIAIGLPSTVVLDPQGRIAARFTGAVAKESLASVLDRLAAET